MRSSSGLSGTARVDMLDGVFSPRPAVHPHTAVVKPSVAPCVRIRRWPQAPRRCICGASRADRQGRPPRISDGGALRRADALLFPRLPRPEDSFQHVRSRRKEGPGNVCATSGCLHRHCRACLNPAYQAFKSQDLGRVHISGILQAKTGLHSFVLLLDFPRGVIAEETPETIDEIVKRITSSSLTAMLPEV